MNEHTLRSWEWQEVKDDGSVTVWTLSGPRDVLCRFWYDAPPSGDALLIAAAPALEHELGGIADALATGETVVIEPGSVKAERIRIAVAKATGEKENR